MKHAITVKVSGQFACFSRPEAKVERLSYECLTPSAARGILDSILWKPEMRWIVRRITVLNEIKFMALKRNEVQSKIAPAAVGRWMKDSASYRPFSAGAGSEEGTPRNTLALRDVAYIIEAEPHVFNANSDNTPVKYVAMFNRRVEKGQAHAQPCLGCREFYAQFEPPTEADTALQDSRDLGVMLYDIIYDPKRDQRHPIFFRAKLNNGVLDTRPEHVLDAEMQKEVLTCSYKL